MGLEPGNLVYAGEAQQLNVQVTFNGIPLTENVDYELSGSLAPFEPGDYAVVIDGMGDYFGSQTVKYSVNEAAEYMLGDVNNDGKIDAGDVNGDDVIDASDASTVLRYYAYLSTGGSEEFESFIQQ